MDFKEFKNSKGGVTGLCVVVDCVAGKDDEVLAGLVENFSTNRSENVLPVSVGYIKNKGDYLIPMLVKDVADADDVIIDKIRSVPGVCDVKSYLFNLQGADEATPPPATESMDDQPFLAHGILFIDVESGKDRDVLRKVAASTDGTVAINFLAHCFHSFDCAMIAFVSSYSHNILFEWIRENVRSIDGVLDTDLDIISSMEPLLLPDEVQTLMTELAKLE